MIEFKELRVTPDGKTLIIDAAVKDLSYYDNVYIESVTIDTQDTYSESGSSTNPLFHYEVASVSDENKKRIRLELNSSVLGKPITGNMFFVYITVKGTPSPDTPCGLDNIVTLGVTADLYPFYRSSVNYMKELENECEPSKNFIDSLLRFKAFELSIRTGHYTQAIKYWNKFFKEVKSNTVNTICRCHG